MFKPAALLFELCTHPAVLLILKLASLFFKMVFFGSLLKATRKAKIPYLLGYSIILFLFTNALSDCLWVTYLLSTTAGYMPDSVLLLTLKRFSWAITIVEYLMLAFFIDQLIRLQGNKFFMGVKAAFYIGGFSIFCVQILAIVFGPGSIFIDKRILDITFYVTVNFYSLTALFCTLYYAFRAIRTHLLPRILATQLKAFLVYAIAPHTVLGLALLMLAVFFTLQSEELQPIFALSTILLTYGLYLCSQRIMKLRFLNLYKEVEVIEIKYGSDFIKYFNDALARLAKVTALKEVESITQRFLFKALEIPPERFSLFMRSSIGLDGPAQALGIYQEDIQMAVESYFANVAHNQDLRNFLYESKILIFDDLDFSYFYQPDDLLKRALAFLKSIKAEVFLPLYDQRTLIGYIILEHGARPHKLYSAVDKEEMIAMTIYLERVVSLLQHANPEIVLKEQKALQENVAEKQHQLAFYRESLLNFNQHKQERRIGIMHYKNRRFKFINQEAAELVPINLDTQVGHYLTQTLKNMAQGVEKEGTARACLSYDQGGHPLVIQAMPSYEDQHVLIIVSLAEVSDMLQHKLDFLETSSQWDYALFLETTKAGIRINELIPGAGSIITNFKINLLAASSSEKPLFLNIPEEDVVTIGEIVHYISPRSRLEIINATLPERNSEIALRLFGSNPLLEPHAKERPLLDKLNNVGTLLIKNIELLAPETQQILLDCLLYGYFRPLRSDRRVDCNVRFIFSSNCDLRVLAREGRFCLELAEELSRWAISFPLVNKLPLSEIQTFIDGYAKQIVSAKKIQALLSITSKEESFILEKESRSLKELKEHIYNLLASKAHKKNVPDFALGLSETIVDPELHKAALLGKNALKDPRIVTMLWHTFQSQSKIAEFLGVNRSSVHKRCKEYNLS